MSPDISIESITATELNTLLGVKEEIIVIHTMIASQYEKVHIPGSLQACVYEVSFLNQIEDIVADKSRAVVLYGADAKTMDAKMAAEKLKAAGYQKIFILSGGIEAWRQEGFDLEGVSTGEVIPSASMLTAGNYAVDIENSHIHWIGRNPNTSHNGHVHISSGVLNVTDDSMTGEFSIEMDSISNINLEGDELQPVLVEHLKSDDFFHTQLFPSATFHIANAQPHSEQVPSSPNYSIEGRLTLRGVENEQSFDATISQTDPHTLNIEAHFDIDRTRWGVIYGSAKYFKHLGMHLVFDHVSIELRIAAKIQ